jgi:4'-phosphopantetheinyl transferase
VWRADLDELKEAFSIDEVLSQRERMNAATFVKALDARRYRYGRALLRGLISKYLAIDSAELILDESAQGKPCLPNPAPLQFSVSHCDHIWYLAISRYGPIGIDVERHHDIADLEALSLSIMTKKERLAFLRVPSEQQGSVFLRCWTRKEALVKAIDIGLAAANLSSLHVGISASPIETTESSLISPMLVRSFETEADEMIGLATPVNATRVEFRRLEAADAGWLISTGQWTGATRIGADKTQL